LVSPVVSDVVVEERVEGTVADVTGPVAVCRTVTQSR
jgi:hypothetical protein